MKFQETDFRLVLIGGGILAGLYLVSKIGSEAQGIADDASSTVNTVSSDASTVGTAATFFLPSLLLFL